MTMAFITKETTTESKKMNKKKKTKVKKKYFKTVFACGELQKKKKRGGIVKSDREQLHVSVMKN